MTRIDANKENPREDDTKLRGRRMILCGKDELCPYCRMILRNYEGLRTCYCKFCGGKIER